MANATKTSSAYTNSWRVITTENPAVYEGQAHWAIIEDCECGQIIADIETGPNQQEHANLIAAVPKLLDDLKQMIELTDSVVGNWENGQELAWAVNALERYAEAARETIAKAECQ